jgi:hypothetical protein
MKKLNLSLFKKRWHLGRRGSKSDNKHVPWSPIAQFFLYKMSGHTGICVFLVLRLDTDPQVIDPQVADRQVTDSHVT